MIRQGMSYTIDPGFLDVKGRLTFAHLKDLNTNQGMSKRRDYADELDYIFRLISVH